MIKNTVLLFLVMIGLVTNAQETMAEPTMADNFRAEGKIYVVIAVMATVFLCVLIYLMAIERRLKKLENDLKNDASTSSASKTK